MDLLLERFLTECYPSLDEADRGAFEQLLEESDPDILNWVTDRAVCPKPEYRTCIAHLKRLQAPAPGAPGSP